MHKHNVVPIEASPNPLDPNPTTAEQVEARLWASDLGVVIVADLGGKHKPFSANLAHEYGFLHGQDKPVVFLVQKRLHETVKRKLSNIQGLVLWEFADGDEAYDDTCPSSVQVRFTQWLEGVLSRIRDV